MIAQHVQFLKKNEQIPCWIENLNLFLIYVQNSYKNEQISNNNF